MDDFTHEYLFTALSLGQLDDGLIDAYFGPMEVIQQARYEHVGAAGIVARAAALRTRLSEVADAQRARWLERQLIAIETLARQFNGEDIPYRELVTRCFDAAPEPMDPAQYTLARAELEELLPGSGDLRPRLDARDDELTVPVDRLSDIVEWLLGELRTAAAGQFTLPAGESLSVTLVNDKPWAAYNWYEGGRSSLIEVNTDLPVRATSLVGLLAHEAFPGHHLEHASKEARLVDEQQRLEASVQLINTPEAYVSEGLAEAGVRFVASAAHWQELLLEICTRAGLALSPDAAQDAWAISQATHRLRGSGSDAALQLHVEGRSHEEVVSFLEHDALQTHQRAEKTLEFINHPLWRTYVFCYAGGEGLIERWLDGATDEDGARQRFARLLTEQLTPSGIAELTAASGPTPA